MGVDGILDMSIYILITLHLVTNYPVNAQYIILP